MKSALVLIGVVLTCIQPAALATTRPEKWNVHTLMAAFAKQTAVKARFHERKYLGVLNRPLDVEGTLVYRAPDMLEKLVRSPVQESYKIKGNKVRVQKKGQAARTFTLTDYPQLSGLIESIRAILKGDGTTLRHLYALTLRGDRQHWTLQLKPKLAPLARQVQRIEMRGKGARMDRIITFRTDGDRSIMTLKPMHGK